MIGLRALIGVCSFCSAEPIIRKEVREQDGQSDNV